MPAQLGDHKGTPLHFEKIPFFRKTYCVLRIACLVVTNDFSRYFCAKKRLKPLLRGNFRTFHCFAFFILLKIQSLSRAKRRRRAALQTPSFVYRLSSFAFRSGTGCFFLPIPNNFIYLPIQQVDCSLRIFCNFWIVRHHYNRCAFIV